MKQEIEVYGNIWTKVTVDPKRVLEELIDSELGSHRNWVQERDGGYYLGYEISLGSHSSDEYAPISKEKYELIRALQKALELLKKYKND